MHPMQITHQTKANETLVDELTVTVDSADYKEQYLQELRKYTRQAVLPGFRAGKVPFGLMQKRFGPSIIAEQVNQMVGRKIGEYIQENKVQFLAKPFLAHTTLDNIDPSGDQGFEFRFELGKEPEFDVNLAALKTYTKYEVSIEDKDLDTLIRRYQHQMGQNDPAEVVDAAKMAQTNYYVLGILSAPAPAEGSADLPFMRFFSFYTQLEPDFGKLVAGKQVKDKVEFVPSQMFKTAFDGASLMRLELPVYEKLQNTTLSFELRQIFTNTPHELNAEFYTKALPNVELPEGDMQAGFRTKLREKMEAESRNMTELYLNDQMRQDLLKAHTFELPDRILQRWLVEEFDEFRQPGALEQRYGQYRDELRLHLIRKKLQAKFPNMALTDDDLRADLKVRLQQYMGTGETEAQIAAEAIENAATEAAHDHDHSHDHSHDHDHGHDQHHGHHHHHDHHHDHHHAHDHDHSHDHKHEHAHASPVDSLVNSFLNDEKFYNREYNTLQNKRFYDVLFTEVAKPQTKQVTFSEFERVMATGSR